MIKQTLSPCFGRGRELFILSLVIICIVSCYYLSSNNWASALTEEAAFTNEDLEIDTTQLSYYGSIFSNLSRGLPIDEIVPSSEPANGQEEEEEDDIQQVNVNSTVQQS
jgi:hypothetical protein